MECHFSVVSAKGPLAGGIFTHQELAHGKNRLPMEAYTHMCLGLGHTRLNSQSVCPRKTDS